MPQPEQTSTGEFILWVYLKMLYLVLFLQYFSSKINPNITMTDEISNSIVYPLKNTMKF